jgi:hypothetical protein
VPGTIGAEQLEIVELDLQDRGEVDRDRITAGRQGRAQLGGVGLHGVGVGLQLAPQRVDLGHAADRLHRGEAVGDGDAKGVVDEGGHGEGLRGLGG